MAFLEGLGLAGYRSFGDELQFIGPFKKINVLIGQNNAGKSNVLAFIRNHLSDIAKAQGGGSWRADTMDYHLTDQGHAFRVALGIDPMGPNLELLVAPIGLQHLEAFRTILNQDVVQQNGLAWFIHSSHTLGGKLELDRSTWSDRRDSPLTQPLRNAWHHALTRKGLSGLDATNMQRATMDVNPATLKYPPVHLVPAIRNVVKGEMKDGDFSGMGLIDRLALLQNPNSISADRMKPFNAIKTFVRSVLENEEATIEIPEARNTILVHLDGKTLPLSSLGTGIHEVIILAASATIVEHSIMCIEEPELHMHPTLQQKFIRYLSTTSNQYFITTHSAHLIDGSDAALFHVKLVSGKTKVSPAGSDNGRSSICADLGYRASDLVQSNSIIWVEGPSDRIYLNHWIQQLDDTLLEGAHYSIMFYGGALRSHLSGNDPEEAALDDFISLRRLNRYMVMIMDSDIKKPDQDINATKVRLRDEFNAGPGFAWITQGREIENYLPYDDLEKAIGDVYPKATEVLKASQYDRALRIKEAADGPVKNELDKVAIARKVVENGVGLDQLDLKDQIEKVVDFIRSANGLRRTEV